MLTMKSALLGQTAKLIDLALLLAADVNQLFVLIGVSHDQDSTGFFRFVKYSGQELNLGGHEDISFARETISPEREGKPRIRTEIDQDHNLGHCSDYASDPQHPRTDLNRRPLDSKSSTLSAELRGLILLQVPPEGFEPSRVGLKVRCSGLAELWRQVGGRSPRCYALRPASNGPE